MNTPLLLRVLLACALALGLIGGAAPTPALAQKATVFIVNDPGDAPDAGAVRNGVCATAGGVCTLRAALMEANGYPVGAPYTITFAVSLGYLIQPATNLPALTRDYTIIDAGSRSVMIRMPIGSTANRGLQIDALHCEIRSLALDAFKDNLIVNDDNNILDGNTITNAQFNGIELNGGGNILTGNSLGVDLTGSAAGNKYGVVVNYRDNRIGTDGDGLNDTAERNLISANAAIGIVINENGSGTVIAGNWIGLNAAGNAALGNAMGGIQINDVGKGAANHVLIGTDDSNDHFNVNEANVISGNGTALGSDFGISIDGGSDHIISGNIIGLNPAGTAMIPNTGYAIQVKSAAKDVIIGVNDNTGNYPEAMRNFISGNFGTGIYLAGSGHQVAGNIIGLDINITNDRGNTVSGIAVIDSSNVIIGTDGDNKSDAYEGNYISGNTVRGILLTTNAISTTIAGNVIGLNKSETAVPNGDSASGSQGGIRVGFGANTVLIGTDGDEISDELERNIISGNTGPGVNIGTATLVTVSGNYIGTDSTGSAARPNSMNGVNVADGAVDVTIGLPDDGSEAQRNLISGNSLSGIGITETSGHIIAGNWIGVNASGSAAIPNNWFGIWLTDASDIRIGTDGNGDADKDEKNLISGNWGFNIVIMGDDSADNWIAGNWIGLDADGTGYIHHPGGMDTGIGVQSGSSSGPVGTIIGTNSDGVNDLDEGNVISGNSNSGIWVAEQQSTVIAGNIIGLSAPGAKGSAKVPNGNGGIHINASSDSPPVGAVQIGTDGNGTADLAERNVISGNGNAGITIDSGGGHLIAGNFIGLDIDGLGSLGNDSNGITISASAATMTLIGTNGDGLADAAERNIISGNIEYGVLIATNSCIVSGNYIGTDLSGTLAIPNNEGGVILLNAVNNYIGIYSDASAGEAAEGNLISGNNGSGVSLWGGVQSWVSGNRIGTSASGLSALPNAAHGVEIDDSATAQVIGVWNDGISDALEGNIISGNDGVGIWVNATLFTQIFGNTIGLGLDKETQVQNMSAGIYLKNTTNTLIGFDNAESRNIISGNHTEGILLSGGDNPGASIIGNLIGTSASGLDAGNGWSGIHVAGSVKAQNFPLAPNPVTNVASNTIQYNGRDGVLVDSYAGRGHKLIDNFFGWNAELGIDLGPDDGVTPNDGPDDPDGLQNYPILETVSFPSSGTIRITGTLNSKFNAHLTIQLYAATQADPSGYGEGIDPIYTFTVNTDDSGNAIFDKTFAYPYGLSRLYFSAIAIAADWSTSEFGPNLELKLVFLPAIMR